MKNQPSGRSWKDSDMVEVAPPMVASRGYVGGCEVCRDLKTASSPLSRSPGLFLAAWVSDEDMHDASKQNASRPFVSLQSWNRDGNFTKDVIAEFVSANKVPLVINFTREGASLISESSVKTQVKTTHSFGSENESEKHLPTLSQVAKSFKGKFVFVYVQMDNEDYGEAVSGFFGVTGTAPKVLYTGNEDMRKFILDGELTVNNIKPLAEDFLADKLKPFYKSDPVPENNDGDVKIIVWETILMRLFLASQRMFFSRSIHKSEEDVFVLPLFESATLWGVFLGFSSNARYQIINRLERVVEGSKDNWGKRKMSINYKDVWDHVR
ncbi:unnamed protein product [Eruca vesicaria subsp. sativa]|uniref:protein disulfide-isomerase n=1 Tax=Eruca vesicaria subsp. sativa TaxID=29727 RepID=A0ABC8IUF3_ERUVS|nr:unnamed protein product [Eruca vesicaria subsp. sativa]